MFPPDLRRADIVVVAFFTSVIASCPSPQRGTLLRPFPYVVRVDPGGEVWVSLFSQPDSRSLLDC